MKLLFCKDGEIKEYIDFTRHVYRGNPYYRDSLTPILRTLLGQKSAFCKNASLTPVMVINNDMIEAVCTFITSKKYPGILQISFFEALENCSYSVDMIVAEGIKICKEKGLSRIIIGMNGHVNYGLGLLADCYEKDMAFGTSYNHPYYLDYFKKYNPMEHNLISYIAYMKKIYQGTFIPRDVSNRINKRFTFRKADLNNLDKEVEVYTYLNNVCFKGHEFYWERTEEEDMEMLKPFKAFIKGENLIIAERNGEPVGFMLWYPDFNQLIKPGDTMGVKTYIKNKLFAGKINKFKIAEIGIIPQYRGSGAAVGLFNKCLEFTKDKYDLCETSWILEGNSMSRGFGIHWEAEEYKHYKVFEIIV